MIFPLKILLKSVSNRVFFALAPRCGFGAAISDTVARSSIAFCNSISADRIVMAASRLLGAAAACVILVSFAAGHRKSYWIGCIKVAIYLVICQLNFGAGDFPFIFLCFTIVFLALAPKSNFGPAISV